MIDDPIIVIEKLTFFYLILLYYFFNNVILLANFTWISTCYLLYFLLYLIELHSDDEAKQTYEAKSTFFIFLLFVILYILRNRIGVLYPFTNNNFYRNPI